jgi:hypothetical protein
MTDASVPKPTLTPREGTPAGGKLEPGTTLEYPKDTDRAVIDIVLTTDKNKPVQITKFKLNNPDNIGRFEVVYYIGDTKKDISVLSSKRKNPDVSILL